MSVSRIAGALCVWSAAALAADGEGQIRLSTEAGYDSNVRRDYEQTGTVSDAEASVTGSAEGRLRGDSGQAFGAYDVGLRKFLQYPSEDTLVQAANGEASWRLGQAVAAGVELHGKDRRGGDRDYTDLQAYAFAEATPGPSASLRLRAGAHRFVYWDAFDFSYDGPEVGLAGRYRFDRRHSVYFSADLGLRTYNALVSLISGATGTDVRKDTAFNGVLGYGYRGRFSAGLSYEYFLQSSNSYGESLMRHRLVATGGFRLPWRLFLLAELALQYTFFPDGIFLSPQILLLEDDEGTSAASVKLVRPLDDHIDVELHAAAYYDQLPGNGLTYFRQVAWVGLTWRL